MSDELVELRLHDDGTLTEADCEELGGTLPAATVLARRDADHAVLELLRRHPQCRAFRARSPLALKLLDVALLETGDLAYCDSDVLFLRPFSGLFEWPDLPADVVFMADVHDAYALRPWHVRPFSSTTVLSHANTGLIHARSARGLDLDLVEHVLGASSLQTLFGRRSYWIEQTCWAVLGARRESWLYDSSQLRVVTPEVDLRSPHLVAAHFVSTFRHRIVECAPTGGDAPSDSRPAKVVCRRALRANPMSLLWSEVRRRHATRSSVPTRGKGPRGRQTWTLGSQPAP